MSKQFDPMEAERLRAALRHEADEQGVQYSAALTERIMEHVRTSPLQPAAGQAQSSEKWALPVAATIAACAVGIWWWTSAGQVATHPTGPPRHAFVESPPDVPAENSVAPAGDTPRFVIPLLADGANDELDAYVQSNWRSSQWAYLDQDAQRLAESIADQFPIDDLLAADK